jgi:hypothetical protein
VGQAVTSFYSTSAIQYTFVFSNAPELAANTHYWILFTSPDAISAQWSTGQLTSTTLSIDINTGAARTSAESVPAAIQVPAAQWNTYPAGTLLLTLTVAGCEVAAPSPTPAASPAASQSAATSLSPAASPTAAPSQSPAASSPQASASSTPALSLSPAVSVSMSPPVASRTPQAIPSATPVVVVLTPITANVTSSFDSTQTSLNLTAPATSTTLCTHPRATLMHCT